MVGTGVATAVNVDGTRGDDKLFGSQGSDRIDAGYGSDTVAGLGGSDRIDAGGGADVVYGEGACPVGLQRDATTSTSTAWPAAARART